LKLILILSFNLTNKNFFFKF